MGEKRRDNKNRILRTGESQRSDGKYMYRYVDGNGKTQCIYSWRLVSTDPIPYGKKDKGALHDKEKLIQRDLDDNIASEGGGYTVLSLTKKYISTKTGVKKTTKAGYMVNDAVTREAITRKEERAFLEFVKNDTHYSKYYDGMYVLFKTGMRISEFTGLTLSDIDMENRTINIDHQLQKTGTSVYIDMTKTYAGRRVIPMTDDVYECFKRILARRNPPKKEPMIDGYAGFLWFDKDGKPMVAMHWEKYFQHAVERYNSIYRLQLPKITPHICRHTYCSNMAKSGMNPKVLQYLMGHSDISVTLNTYTHLKLDDARDEMVNMNLLQEQAEKEMVALGQKEEEHKLIAIRKSV